MKILVIEGTNFILSPVVRQLCQMGHEVSVFHRGRTTAELPANVRHLLGDRFELTQMKSQFEQISPQVVLDMFPLEMIAVRDRILRIRYSAFKPFNIF